VSVVSDQLGRPTAARDLAHACLGLCERLLDRDARARGLFHYSGAGDATWADFAEVVFARAKLPGGNAIRVKPILTADYPTPAKRPANSRLDTSKIESLGIVARPWRDSVDACVAELNRT
jgi:dTDP-4-dehydrorhamnose reductase